MLKQLLEDGFDVTIFERRDKVGGLWAYDANHGWTTALKGDGHSVQLLRSVLTEMRNQILVRISASIHADSPTFLCRIVCT